MNRATSCHSLLHTEREGVEGLAGLVEVLGGEGVRSEVRQVLQPVCNAQQLPVGAVPAGTSFVSTLCSAIVGAPPNVAPQHHCAGAHSAIMLQSNSTATQQLQATVAPISVCQEEAWAIDGVEIRTSNCELCPILACMRPNGSLCSKSLACCLPACLQHSAHETDYMPV